MKYISYGRQDISEEDIESVIEVLRSEWLTQGPSIERFERAVASSCRVSHAVAASNGTAALHMACAAAGLGAGDWLWTTPNTFVASANCARYCGASVDFVDIEPDTLNLSVDALRRKLEHAKRDGKLPKIVVPVHFAGQPCRMREIAALSAEFNFVVIEDASHAMGASYFDGPVGSCEHSDMTVFSFHPVKIATSAEGGMVTTNSSVFRDRMRLFRSHGITRDKSLMSDKFAGDWYYEQLGLGFNYRISDLHAALGSSQLARVPEFVLRRRELAARYDVELAGLPLRPQVQMPGMVSAYHLYVIRLKLHQITVSRKAVFERMRKMGIGVNVHYIPVHLQPYFQKMGFKKGDFPVAETYYEEALTLPLHTRITTDDQDAVIRSLVSALDSA